MKVLAVYVGKASEANLHHGLRQGIWGFKERAKPEGFNQLQPGDVILLGFAGASPRTEPEEWIKTRLKKIYIGRIVAPSFTSKEVEWPDEPQLPEGERYVHRIRFDPHTLQELTDPALGDAKLLSPVLADLIRRSGCASGKGFLVDPKELPALENGNMNPSATLELSLLLPRMSKAFAAAGVKVSDTLLARLVASLLSKRFLILTGLAGSGKTKVAQALARWLAPRQTDTSPSSYVLVPVGADWTGNENVVGYPDGLVSERYVTRPALELIRRAIAAPDVPHFLILDEMNLSHVERYFADLLSAIESEEEIPLYEGDPRQIAGQPLPPRLRIPGNLLTIGTVNVDETTYMFSPKVLDRANVVEFRMEPDELQAFLSDPAAPNFSELDGMGSTFCNEFVRTACDKTIAVPAEVKSAYEQEMMILFGILRQHGSEFGYRMAYETARFIHFYKVFAKSDKSPDPWFAAAMDAVIVQKVLPKLHGSRSKLEGLLWALAWACGDESLARNPEELTATCREAGKAQDEGRYAPEVVERLLASKGVSARYPMSFDKVLRMVRKLARDQFVTFAEA